MTKHEQLFGTWADPLKDFLESSEFKAIGKELKKQFDANKIIRPLFDETFRAFKTCPYNSIKIVFLTVNPYLGDEPDGLALSCRKELFQPPAVLGKVFDQLEKEALNGLYLDRSNDLERWAKQGVLLLNCDLSGIRGRRGSHLELWHPFIKFIIKKLNAVPGVIFTLIGSYAQKHLKLIDQPAHDVHMVEHPMQAVIENRDWNSNGLFTKLNEAVDFIFNEKIKWS